MASCYRIYFDLDLSIPRLDSNLISLPSMECSLTVVPGIDFLIRFLILPSDSEILVSAVSLSSTGRYVRSISTE